jgi:catechol 2,3-dioxygenase-like lactoylglutathione lyase family enzyme
VKERTQREINVARRSYRSSSANREGACCDIARGEAMHYQLEHVAVYCRDINESIKFYEKFFGGSPTAIRKGAAGYGFCFMKIDGAPSIQLMESESEVGVHHYGFVTDNIEQAAKEFKEKGAQIIRENRDPSGRLTTIFVKDPNGLELEIRSPR